VVCARNFNRECTRIDTKKAKTNRRLTQISADKALKGAAAIQKDLPSLAVCRSRFASGGSRMVVLVLGGCCVFDRQKKLVTTHSVENRIG
jgi:hypothetical protein